MDLAELARIKRRCSGDDACAELANALKLRRQIDDIFPMDDLIRNVAPDIPLRDVVLGVLPFVGLMALAVLVLCLAPSIATWFPDVVLGLRTS